MALKWKNPQTLDQYIQQVEEACRKAAFNTLAELGEKMLADARNDASNARHFTDRTGNLRSSIGYAVVQDGKIVIDAYGSAVSPAPGCEAESNPTQAQAESRTHAEALASTLDSSKTWLIFVAGMDYASYVEARGFDVITGTYDQYSTSEELKQLKIQFVTDVSETMAKLKSKA